MELDRTDLALVDALQHDARQRLEDLARRVQLAPSSVYERLRRLEEGGIIRRWTIDLDADSVGLGVLAYVGIRSSKPCSAIVPAIEGIAAVEECHSVAGELSLLLKVRVASTAALVELAERLRLIPGIEGTETTIVLKTRFDRPIAIPKPEPPKRTRSRATRSA
jgi:Lrp/AsnC family transcriptional regulator, leucine-responsive regulatory protein